MLTLAGGEKNRRFNACYAAGGVGGDVAYRAVDSTCQQTAVEVGLQVEALKTQVLHYAALGHAAEESVRVDLRGGFRLAGDVADAVVAAIVAAPEPVAVSARLYERGRGEVYVGVLNKVFADEVGGALLHVGAYLVEVGCRSHHKRVSLRACAAQHIRHELKSQRAREAVGGERYSRRADGRGSRVGRYVVAADGYRARVRRRCRELHCRAQSAVAEVLGRLALRHHDVACAGGHHSRFVGKSRVDGVVPGAVGPARGAKPCLAVDELCRGERNAPRYVLVIGRAAARKLAVVGTVLHGRVGAELEVSAYQRAAQSHVGGAHSTRVVAAYNVACLVARGGEAREAAALVAVAVYAAEVGAARHIALVSAGDAARVLHLGESGADAVVEMACRYRARVYTVSEACYAIAYDAAGLVAVAQHIARVHTAFHKIVNPVVVGIRAAYDAAHRAAQTRYVSTVVAVCYLHVVARVSGNRANIVIAAHHTVDDAHILDACAGAQGTEQTHILGRAVGCRVAQSHALVVELHTVNLHIADGVVIAVVDAGKPVSAFRVVGTRLHAGNALEGLVLHVYVGRLAEVFACVMLLC